MSVEEKLIICAVVFVVVGAVLWKSAPMLAAGSFVASGICVATLILELSL